MGRRGFQVRDYLSWNRIGNLSADVSEALYVFLGRVESTYEFLKELHLLSPDDYVRAYAGSDDFAVAYPATGGGLGD